jgi:hypothetical protein
MSNSKAPRFIRSRRGLMLLIGLAIALLGATAGLVTSVRNADAALGETIVRGDGVGFPGAGTTYSLDMEVFDEAVIGNTVFVAGKFTRIWDNTKQTWVDQPFLAAFDGTTGRYLPFFRPKLEGPAYALEPLGNKLLVGGEFRSVNNMPETNALALIDPTTSEVVPNWISSPQNGTSRAKVHDMVVSGNEIYLAGSFRTIIGGPSATAKTVSGINGLARVSATDGTPDLAWKPVVIGPVWSVAVSADRERVHVGGNFDSVSGQGPTIATIRRSDASAVVGWNVSKPSTWTNITQYPYLWRGKGWAVFDLAVHGDMLWIGGAEHGYAAKSSATGATLIDRSTRHDTQRVEVIDGKVYIGCHCKAYSTGDTVRDLPFFELDAATGAQTSTFSRYLEGADGGWAITKTPDGCVWPGGDFRAGRDAAGTRVWIPGFTKICDVSGPKPHTVPGVANAVKADTTAPSTPGGVSVRAVGGFPVLAWQASTDDRAQVAYRIYRDGTLVGSTRTLSFTDSVPANEPHSWVVIAYDGAGKVSAPSARVTLGAGAVTPVTLTTPVQRSAPVRYDQRVEFSVDAPPSNVAYIEAALNGTVVDRYYSDAVQPLANVAVGTTVRMSSVAGGANPALLTDGICCNVPNIDTTAQRDPWVEVDLGAEYAIEGVDRMLNGLISLGANTTYFLVRPTPFTETDPAVAAAAPGTTSVSLSMPGASLMQQVVGRGRYVRIWMDCDSCYLRVAEVRVWGGSVKAPVVMSIPGGEGTYTFRSVGIDGTKSAPLTYNITASTPFVTADWRTTIDIAASQSSTRLDAVASRAIDGNLDGNFAANTSSVTGTPRTKNLAREPGAAARSMEPADLGSVPADATDGNTNGNAASGSVFVSKAGSGATTNLLAAAGATVTQSATVDAKAAARAVDGNTDGSDAANSTATAGGGQGGQGGAVNWAREPGVTISQSSDLAANSPAGAAIDGNNASYSSTKRYEAGWLRLDLGSDRAIDDLQLWPRTDEKWWFTAQASVYFSSVPFTGTTLAQVQATPGVTKIDITKTPNQGQQFPVGRNARYVHIVRTVNDAFMVSELALNGTKPAGTTAFWQADLGASRELSGLRLWPRTGCCANESANVRVLFSASPFASPDVAAATAQAGVTHVDVAAIAPGTAVAAPASTRYLRIQKLDGDNLSLAEVHASAPTVRQWWEADLGAVGRIDNIAITPRTDCCAAQTDDYWVFVSPTPFEGNSPEAAMAKPDVKVIAVDNPGAAQLPVGADGRYVRIQKRDAEALALTEVAVNSTATPEWWQADLGEVRDLRSVRIYPRTDCCGSQSTNIRIMYSDTPFASADPNVAITQPGVTYRDVTTPVSVGQYFWIGRRARYVRIQHLNNEHLTLAEVRLDGRQP